MKRTLILFSTKCIREDLNGPMPNEAWLFDAQDTAHIQALRSASQLKNFYEQHQGDLENPAIDTIYRVSGDLLFGAYNLVNELIRKGQDVIQSYLEAYLSDVLSALSEEEMAAIGEIKFVLHQRELASSGEITYEEIYDEDLVELVNEVWRAKFDDPRPIIGIEEVKEDQEEKEEMIKINFIAFSHGASNRAINLLQQSKTALEQSIKTPDLPAEAALSAHIAKHLDQAALRALRREEKNILGDSNFKIDADKIKQLGLKFNFVSIAFNQREREVAYEPFEDDDSLFYPFYQALQEASVDSEKEVTILFTDTTNLIRKSVFDQIPIEFETYLDQQKEAPVVTISPLDIMWAWEEDQEEALEERAKLLRELGLDKRYRFFDASIWFRYLSIESFCHAAPKPSFAARLEKMLAIITENYSKRLYYKNVAREYRDLVIRLVKESKLEEFGGGHASAIIPFRFHSETLMQQRADNFLEQFQNDKFEWDFLVVDDFANKNLREGEKKGPEDEWKKKKVILDLIDHEGKIIHNEKETIVSEDIQDAIALLGGKGTTRDNRPNRAFDVILLDYLFSFGKNGEELAGTRYSTELLQDVKERGHEYYSRRGPYGAFWFFPVTVFPAALTSAMVEKSIQRSTEHYNISSGADPINAPQLFREQSL